MKVYIAGKVTGEPKHSCALKFATAQKELEKLGHEVINPIEVVGDFNARWAHAMRLCIREMMLCDAVFLLPDWLDSTGATMEAELAEAVDIMVVDSIEDLTVENLEYFVKSLGYEVIKERL